MLEYLNLGENASAGSVTDDVCLSLFSNRQAWLFQVSLSLMGGLKSVYTTSLQY